MTNADLIKSVSISRRGRPATDLILAPSIASYEARPKVWLGAKSPGGLALPAAHPTPSQMYAPRGVWIDRERLIVCDSGNHRVMIWSEIPERDGAPADVVLGQKDFYTEGPACGTGDFRHGLHLPTGVLVAEGKLLVADAWHHRILVWNQVPTESNLPPDAVIGQVDASHVLPNRGAGPTAKSLNWPYGMAYIAGRFYVADTGNRRVLGWKGIPNGDTEAHLVLGQPDANSADENRGGAIGGDTFRWPHAIAGDENGLWIADAGNHRVLGWRGHPEADCSSDFVLGQESMSEAREWPTISKERIAFVFRMG